MKSSETLHLFFGALMAITLASCGKTDPEADKTAIIDILKSETEAFAQGDYDRWTDCWKQSPDILLTYTENNASSTFLGWQEVSEAIKSTMEEMDDIDSPKFSRDYHLVEVEGNLAWTHFTQTDTLDGIPTIKHESRTLQRIDGDWKIIGSNIVNQTSFGPQKYLLNANQVIGETHIPLREFPKDMIVNHVEGWGGMAVAINQLPAGTDFGPLLEGLENNSCQVPHWGYLEKGAIRMTYVDGKAEVLQAGEVFYMPPGHTAVVEKNAKLIDFSPEAEFKEVVNHIEEKVAMMQQQ